MSKVKRWQLSLRGILGYMALVALPFGVGQLARVGDGILSVIAIASALIAANGVCWASIGWLLSGTAREFWLGYASGVVIPALFVVFGLFMLGLMWLGS